jgi:hypothetical protein
MTLEAISDLLSPDDPEISEGVRRSVSSTTLYACKKALLSMDPSERKLEVASVVVGHLLAKEFWSDAATLTRMARRDVDILCQPPCSAATKLLLCLKAHELYERSVIETQADPTLLLKRALSAAKISAEYPGLKAAVSRICEACKRIHRQRFRHPSQDPVILGFSQEFTRVEGEARCLLNEIR